MKHLTSLLAALCLAAPATGFSHDGHYYGHGHYYCGHGYYGHHGHFYGPWLPGLPFLAAAALPFYAGYYGPSVNVSYGDSYDSGPVYHGSYHGEPAQSASDSLAMDVQHALQQQGYYHGGVDGDIGPGTRAAIRQYQYDQRLEVTGRIDKALLRSLGMD